MQTARGAPSKKNLLLCLDAFGTLFKPTRPIAATYAEAGARHGVPTGGAAGAEAVQQRFKKAFKGESSRSPNYGKATGLGAEKWWGNVIRNTFSPFMDVGKHVPPALITELYQSFSSKEPYTLYPDVQKFFLELQKYKDASKTRQLPWPFKRIVVGIISNSDDRVPGILQSFGLQVGSRRAGTSSNIETHSSFGNDVDFVVLSYDVGYEKPHRRIFDAATSLLSGMPSDDGGQLNPDDFEKLYVGDELKKDYQGANRVGWHSVLLDRNGVMDRARGFRFGRVGLEDENGKEHKVLMARSLLDLELWRPISPISQTWNNHERLHPWDSDSNAK